MANNSFSKVYEQIINYNNNVLGLMSELNSLMVSGQSSVSITANDTVYDVPSWSYLQSEIQRMNNNINSLYSINENGALIQTADNIWKKVVLVDLNKQPNQVSELTTISNFESDNNHFFDSLIDPFLKVKFDLSNRVEDNVREVLVRRYIVKFSKNSQGELTNSGQTALTSFNTNYRNKSSVSLSDFVQWCRTTPGLESNIPYYDESKFELEPNQVLYSGLFTVLSIDEDSVNRKLWYNLNSLDYTLVSNGATKTLKVGDSLTINREKTSTIYNILEISNTNASPRIRLERIQGNEAIPVGEGTLKIYSPVVSNKSVKVTVGYDEHNVVFIKAINSDNYIMSADFSPGVGYYTNDLRLSSNDSDNGISMEEFYLNKVSDYGLAVKDLVKTRKPIATGKTPNRVSLLESNFKVVQINNHLTDNTNKKEITDKYSKMGELKGEITQLEQSINSKKKESRLTTFKSSAQKKTFDTQLRELINKKESSSKLLRSTTNDIITLTTSPNTNKNIKPKYRLRGFWDFPNAIVFNGIEQEVVQFKIQYRYLSNNGDKNKIDTFDLKKPDGTDLAIASFSDWETIMSGVRKRVYNSDTDEYTWEVEDLSNSDITNINQLDVPIQKGESVQIRIKSISEVGFPDTILESDWSELLSMPFPDDLSSIVGEEDFILNQALKEDTVVQIKNELGNVEEHLADEITIGDKTYYHSADTIMSGVPDANGNQQSLLDYLRVLTNRIQSLEEQINRSRGVLQVYLYRDEEEFLVKNDTELQFNVNCEDYLDIYDEDSSVTGRVYRNNIYTIKDFYLKIYNASSSSPLGLVSNRNYDSDNNIYSRKAPQTFWVNDRDELLVNNSSGSTRTQLNNQFLWSVNFDGSSNNSVNKLSENIGNDFTNISNNSLTNILSSTEYNLGYNENTILEFESNNNSLLDTTKWVDISPTVKSSTKLLSSIHPSIQNIEDLVETNSDKVKTFKSRDELLIPINIYFKMNAFDSNSGSGKDYDYIDLNNSSSTTRHIKRIKFFLENEADNKPFIFRAKFTLNRSNVVVQKLGKNNNLSRVSKFVYKPSGSSITGLGENN